jgi:[ribosomal protein S5]-alanine N-acetyltransferase
MRMGPRQSIRLRLRYERPWREHEQLYVDLFADPAVATTLWPGTLGGVRTPEQARAVLETDIEHWRAAGFGPWVCYERASGVFVARGGLRGTTVAGRRCVEVLYAVRSDAWGRGYASEIATVAVAHARERGLTDVVGFTLTTNAASRRVLEKIGMRFDATTFEHAGLPHLLGRLLPNS